jgi:Fe-S cluster assembly protein SufD
LSETAEFDAKPELEIYADDVACGHGATSGDLNHDHLFYLKSRGIPEAEARALLVAAFAGEAFETIHDESIRAALADHAGRWLGVEQRAR